jgi:hypothetical protein
MQKKTVPAVWFQNQLTPPRTYQRSTALELFEAQLAQVTGGLKTPGGGATASGNPLETDDMD